MWVKLNAFNAQVFAKMEGFNFFAVIVVMIWKILGLIIIIANSV